MKTIIFNLIVGLFIIFLFVFCSKSNDSPTVTPPVLISSVPTENQIDVDVTTEYIELIYNQEVAVVSPHNITLNGNIVKQPEIVGKTVKIQVSLQKNESYTLLVPAEQIKGLTGAAANPVTLPFSTEKNEEVPGKNKLVTLKPMPAAQKVYDFLHDIYGEKILSGTMSNVAWNINEAEWVNKHIGKYPAMAGFDYIFLHYSPANWINYENTKVLEDWWMANGLITASWHWNVPSKSGTTNPAEYAFYTSETTFDIREAIKEGTWQNQVIKDDLEKIANNILLLQQKGIPVLWRPLHEASGGWFWWGAKGAEPFKKLWILMFETFQKKGLNNLIWVWTAEGDTAWYPGDEYVDIIGRDLYTKTPSVVASEYVSLKNQYPGKMISLSECGGVGHISTQWDEGARWSWFMPWYDYERTNDTTNSAFNEITHEHADISWWKDAMNQSCVVFRESMPDLK